MTLDIIPPGSGGIIESIGGEGALRRRLLDMGLTPGTTVTVRKVAPMGDPIELYLRSYVLTLRRDDAANIQMKEVHRIGSSAGFGRQSELREDDAFQLSDRKQSTRRKLSRRHRREKRRPDFKA